MYFNNVSIILYVVAGILGLIVGNLVDWANIVLPQGKKFFSKDFFRLYLKNYKPNYLLQIIMAVIYIVITYFVGSRAMESIPAIIDYVKYIILAPLLVSAFIIDYKEKIIPNRLTLTIFEVGLLATVFTGMYNINLAINMMIGAFAGAGIFLLITLVGGLIAGKEAMGLGDVKLMGGLGLFFGLTGIIEVSLIAFLLAAIISIFLMITKIKSTKDYIPFGPFIVIACFIVMLVPADILTYVLFTIFSLGLRRNG